VSPNLLSEHIDGGWSVKETVGHLISVESLHIGRLDDYDANLAQLRPADMTNTRTYEARYNDKDIAELLGSFRAIRSDFVGRLRGLDEERVSRSAHHPRLDQPMRLVDMALFAAEHDDQHIAILLQML
jgi:exonuclease I